MRSRSVLCYSWQPYGLEPARLLCPRDFPGKETGVGCHSLLQVDLPDPGIEPASPASASGILYLLGHLGSLQRSDGAVTVNARSFA